MNIFVTGSDGFVGINILKQLLKHDDTIICGSRHDFTPEKLSFLDDKNGQLRFEKVDVTDTEKLDEVMKKHKVNAVIHAAAVTPTWDIESNYPERVMRVNYGGTVNVLEAARKNGVEHVVYVSSNGMYGKINDCDEVIHEDHANDPESLYALAKYTSEAYCRRMSKITGMRIVSGRVCSTYGPMEAPTASRTHMSTVHDLIFAAINHKEIKVVRPEIKRNWTHIYDIAGALCALLYAEAPSYAEYNLSAGKNYSLTTVMETIRKYFPDFKFSETTNADEADIVYNDNSKRGYLDVTRLFNDIQYKPMYPDLDAGIGQYVTWLKEHAA